MSRVCLSSALTRRSPPRCELSPLADTCRSGASRFGSIEGRQAPRSGDSRKAFPWRQAKRAAPQARRHEGLKPNGRDGAAGTGPSPKARRCEAPARHAVRATTASTLEVGQHGPPPNDDVASMPCCKAAQRPTTRAGRRAAVRPPGACCATRSAYACRLPPRSAGHRPWPGTKDRRESRTRRAVRPC